MRLLAQTPGLCIQYDDQHGWLYAQWYGEMTKPVVVEGCRLLLEYQRLHGTSKLLSDNVLISRPWPEGITWGTREWLPAMAEAGLRYLAWVYSPHLLSRMIFDQSQLDVMFPMAAAFDDVAQAVEWLQNQQPEVGITSVRW
ncbi:hypothetical protein HMJ29_04945 [Hymenobacter taeanensis]|uniref:STAS/SEC14 domain-containing protein n=1 Tax=Hymenobacter taeanensis TaxID=2735321 RepID=A0A6M6BDM0_9BACT|nr:MULTISPECIES: hypothetical protein [Hymenobacter]QJX46317.1 hypothetical protein HMJ29_04945 [Hymenobacter taeanensis]UOQ80175.1 hypothetical protein MUN83_15235 [Hymenobacter sp. 5414T-23]